MLLKGTADPVLSFRGLSHAYRRRRALEGIELELPKGVTALLGPNGAGKSTLLKIGAGELRPSVGSVTTTSGGQTYHSERRPYRRRLGWLPQNFSVPLNFTALEFLRYVAWLRGVPSGQLRTAAEAALGRVGLTDMADERLGAFSGGMIRRIGIAQATVHSPAVVLLDEPTVGLDPGQRAEFRRIITELGTSTVVLLSTHLTDDVAVACDSVVVLSNGRVEFIGSTEEFRQRAGGAVAGETEFESAYRQVIASGQR